MKKAWVIVGEKNTGKSSLVRGLTTIPNAKGQGNPNCTFIKGRNELDFRIYGFISGLQESGIDIVTFGKMLTSDNGNTDDNITNILVPLRYNPNDHKGITYPAGEYYVNYLIDQGWDIMAIISLGENARDWVKESGAPFASYIATKHPVNLDMSPNELVAKVRNNFGWI